MYEKPLLKRLGKLREITERIVAFEPLAGDWSTEPPGLIHPERGGALTGRLS